MSDSGLFRFTLEKLRQCYEVLQVQGIESLSMEEQNAAEQMISTCSDIHYSCGGE